MRAVEKSASGPGHVGLVDKAVPDPGPLQVRLEVIGAGVCGTDLHIVEEGFPSYPPVTMGHEVAGIVRAAGPGVEDSWVGARVSCETYYSTCGVCPWCRDGRPNLCPDRRSIGSGADGGFARFLVVFASQLHRVPAHIEDHAAALCEPLACICQALCDPNVVNPGDDVLITGPGTMGLLAAQVSRACGGRVLMVGTEKDHRRLGKASELGFDVALAANRAAMIALGDGHGPHVVVECSGSGAAMSTCLEVVRRGGRYVQIGQTAETVTVPLALVSFKEISITGGFASTPASWRRGIALLEQRLVALEPLVSDVVSLEDWERVFADTSEARGIKFVFDPRR